jgi:CRISPR-associated protein Csd1
VGIGGDRTNDTVLISADKEAFTSYGLRNSLIAPTCLDCSENYAVGLNHLLADPAHHVHIGGLSYVFWTTGETGFDPARLLSNPDPRDVRELYRAAGTGRSAALDIDRERFYALALGASGSRAAVLSWLDVSIREAQEHLARWFAFQELVDASGEPGKPLGAWRLASATVRDARKERPAPSIPTALLRAALGGAPLPMHVLEQAVRRNRAEQRVTRPRAVLIKLVLCSQPDVTEEEITAMSELNGRNTEPAYLCGRLLAVLEAIQRQALNPNATIVDRYYGSASSAPASVFGTLLHGAQPHLSKMQKSPKSRGAAIALGRRLEEVLGGLETFPTTLTLREQGLFALGFYHQKAADRKAARERWDLNLLPPDDDDAGLPEVEGERFSDQETEE